MEIMLTVEFVENQVQIAHLFLREETKVWRLVMKHTLTLLKNSSQNLKNSLKISLTFFVLRVNLVCACVRA